MVLSGRRRPMSRRCSRALRNLTSTRSTRAEPSYYFAFSQRQASWRRSVLPVREPRQGWQPARWCRHIPSACATEASSQAVLVGGPVRLRHACVDPRHAARQQVVPVARSADERRWLGGRVFRANAPAGKESNWIPTDAKGRFEALFRFYGPEKPLFEKTWVLPDIEKA